MTVVKNGVDLMDVVRKAMDGEDVHLLHRRIDVSKSALYAIRRGKTRWPRDYTLFALANDLGIEVQITRKRRK